MILPPNVQTKAVVPPSKQSKRTIKTISFNIEGHIHTMGQNPKHLSKGNIFFSHRCGISRLRPQAKRSSLDQQPHKLQQLSFGGKLALATERTKKAATQCAKTWAGRALGNGTRQHSWDTPPGSKFLESFEIQWNVESNETLFWKPLCPSES